MVFPAHPKIGARHSNGTVEWEYDGVAWRVAREPLPPRPKIIKPAVVVAAVVFGAVAAELVRAVT